MSKKALINIIAALVAAIISGIILFETLVANNILGEIGLLGIFLSSLFSHLTVIGRGIFGPSFLLMAPIYNPIILGKRIKMKYTKNKIVYTSLLSILLLLFAINITLAADPSDYVGVDAGDTPA